MSSKNSFSQTVHVTIYTSKKPLNHQKDLQLSEESMVTRRVADNNQKKQALTLSVLTATVLPAIPNPKYADPTEHTGPKSILGIRRRILAIIFLQTTMKRN